MTLETAKIETYPISKSLIPYFKRKLKAYVNNLPLDKEAQYYLADEDFIDNNPGYYTYYPYLFSEEMHNSEEIDLLAIAGFLYYKSIIILDDLFDKDRVKNKMVLMAILCQEESIKILSKLFDLNSEFWNYWNKRKSEYKFALKQDKELKEIRSMKIFEQQAGFKSAFGKVAIDALFVLKLLKEDQHRQLINSHKYFYVAFQILDDLDDFSEDLSINQFNIAFCTLQREMVARGLTSKDYGSHELNKLVYLFGIADKLLDQAIHYLRRSDDILQDGKFDSWRTEIKKLNNIAVSRKLKIKGFIKKTELNLKVSDQTVFNKNLYNFDNQIQDGLRYVIDNQNPDGSWNEFYNDAGMSDSWATAFILSYINQKELKHYLPETTISKAQHFLDNQNNDLLWGYNKSWIPDTDSTTFVLLAYRLFDKLPSNSFQNWLTLQTHTGGFTTYFNDETLAASMNWEELGLFSGWTQPHICVSAAAFYLMSMVSKLTSINPHYLPLRNFILKKQNDNGLWDSYWWTSPIYSTSLIIKASTHLEDQEVKQAVTNCLEQLFQLQNDDGSFGDEFTKSSPFYTAMVIEACCANWEIYFNNQKEIKRSIAWLQRHQMTDGSWKGTASMRMPTPDVTNPQKIKTWPEDTKGLNIRVTEINRLFTSATCLAALAKYHDISN